LIIRRIKNIKSKMFPDRTMVYFQDEGRFALQLSCVRFLVRFMILKVLMFNVHMFYSGLSVSI
jgi:hypothetical protein